MTITFIKDAMVLEGKLAEIITYILVTQVTIF
jgi:hypothetical protein